jgi:hypothetical protein
MSEDLAAYALSLVERNDPCMYVVLPCLANLIMEDFVRADLEAHA